MKLLIAYADVYYVLCSIRAPHTNLAGCPTVVDVTPVYRM